MSDLPDGTVELTTISVRPNQATWYPAISTKDLKPGRYRITSTPIIEPELENQLTEFWRGQSMSTSTQVRVRRMIHQFDLVQKSEDVLTSLQAELDAERSERIDLRQILRENKEEFDLEMKILQVELDGEKSEHQALKRILHENEETFDRELGDLRDQLHALTVRRDRWVREDAEAEEIVADEQIQIHGVYDSYSISSRLKRVAQHWRQVRENSKSSLDFGVTIDICDEAAALFDELNK